MSELNFDDYNYKPLHDDRHYFDEIHIRTIPRFKESELSGDEWRVSARIELMKKGETVFDTSFSNIDYCARWLPFGLVSDAWFADSMTREIGKHYCDQPGCNETAISILRIITHYNAQGELASYQPDYMHRKFCHNHLQRGNADMEDRDSNYEWVEGEKPPEEWSRHLINDGSGEDRLGDNVIPECDETRDGLDIELRDDSPSIYLGIVDGANDIFADTVSPSIKREDGDERDANLQEIYKRTHLPDTIAKRRKSTRKALCGKWVSPRWIARESEPAGCPACLEKSRTGSTSQYQLSPKSARILRRMKTGKFRKLDTPA